jgi:epoxide hydrolase A/B
MVMPFARRTLLRALTLSIASPAFASRAVSANQAPSSAPVVGGKATPSEVTHRTLMLNGLKFHIAEAGQRGRPLVLLCHGWPECWYSWRNQLPALAEAGFRAVAPDMRGFGQTDAPDDVSAYTIVHNVGDMVGLVAALGEQEAVIIGHDWGAFVAWACAVLRSDIFRAVVAMSGPYIERGPSPPLKALRDAGTTTFYWQYFQTPGIAEAEFERDVDRTMRAELYGTGKSFMVKPGQGFLTEVKVPQQLPSWLTEEDIAYYVDTYKRTGFRSGLNFYRNIDRNWELSAAWDRMKIRQPAFFIAGTEDLAINTFGSKALLLLSNTVPGLKGIRLIAGAGHFVQEERAAEVNAAVIDFLHTV